MGIFNYKGYSSAESANLASLTHTLSIRGMVNSAAGLTDSEVLDLVGNALDSPKDFSLPAGWSVLSPDMAGFSADMIDDDGYIKLISPISGNVDSGPQLSLFQQKDAAGNVIGLGLVFPGTNSVVDILDYAQLNSGEMHTAMAPVLATIRTYAKSLGLDGNDVLVTGYSLGGGYTNIMARYADTLAGGFFANSDYVAHAAPVIYDEDDRVLNIGHENDVVFRAAGNHATFEDAVNDADPLLSNPDRSYDSTTDNFILFDASYAAADVTQAVDSLLNIGSWASHLSGAIGNAIERVGGSSFYEFTDRDSVVVVSDLGKKLRNKIWVEDKDSPTSNHDGTPAFIIGTDHADRLKDGSGNDWLDGGRGNDLIRVSDGYNRVDGGEGNDILRLDGKAKGYSAYQLSDGTLALVNNKGVTIAENVENVEFVRKSVLGIFDVITNYSIKSNRLEDNHWSLFERGDRDIPFGLKTEGTADADILSSRVVFAQGGNDRVSGTSGKDLLIGGEGQDTLKGGAGADRLYGGEHADSLIADSDGDRLNGGHGNDIFIFSAGISGTVIVEDFNAAAGEADQLSLTGVDSDALLTSARASGYDVLLQHDNLIIRLEDTLLSDLDGDSLLIA